MRTIDTNCSIPSELIRSVANTIAVNSTKHVNHNDCPAGEDTRHRLYVTRKTHLFSIAYCHNCGNSGYAFIGEGRLSDYDPRADAADEVAGTALHADYNKLEAIPDNLSCSWIGTLDVPFLTVCGFRSIGHNVVCFPVMNTDGNIVGVQARRVTPSKGPKYTFLRQTGVASSAAKKGRVFYPLIKRLPSETVVLVEDAVSACCVAKADPTKHVVALLGVNLHDDLAAEIALGYTSAVVWLDNDNTTVRRAARSIANRLSCTGVNVDVVTELSDPKHYSTGTILKNLKPENIAAVGAGSITLSKPLETQYE